VLVKKIGDEESEALAKTRVLGGGGCMFLHETTLGVGSAIELLISLRGRVIKALGQVVWEAPATGGGVEVGVEFINVPAEDRQVLDTILASGPRSPES
jgi:hypothetical protein